VLVDLQFKEIEKDMYTSLIFIGLHFENDQLVLQI